MRNKFKTLLAFRALQLYRLAQSVGGGLLLLFVFCFFGIAAQLLGNLLEFPSFYSVYFLAIILTGVDFNRGDKYFLRSIFPTYAGVSLYTFTEYFLVSFGIVLFQLIHLHFLTAFCLMLLCILFGMVSPLYIHKWSNAVKTTINIIPLSLFEFKFMVEKNPVFFTFFWLLSILSVIHIGIFIAWITICLMMLPEMFKYYESREMVHWNPDFLLIKFRRYLGLFLLLVSAPIVLTCIYHSTMILVVMYALLCLFTALLMCISHKYAGFSGTSIYSKSSNIVGFMILLMIIPGGVVIAMGYAIWQYLLAKKNMNYLYA